jgi:putative acetyltransferase
MTIRTKSYLVLSMLATLVIGCEQHVEPYSVSRVDRSVSGPSQYPIAVDPSAVGRFPGEAKSGAGYFYDDVLEYRVWLHPKQGAKPLAGGSAYFAAFAQFEHALAFSRANAGAEQPLALIRQREWINEPTPGKFVHEKGERITEWKVEWLSAGKRTAVSIEQFLASPRPPKAADKDE